MVRSGFQKLWLAGGVSEAMEALDPSHPPHI